MSEPQHTRSDFRFALNSTFESRHVVLQQRSDGSQYRGSLLGTDRTAVVSVGPRGLGLFVGDKTAALLNLIIHLFISLRLRKSGAMPPFLNRPSS
jgi:hypothetical protein